MLPHVFFVRGNALLNIICDGMFIYMPKNSHIESNCVILKVGLSPIPSPTQPSLHSSPPQTPALDWQPLFRNAQP